MCTIVHKWKTIELKVRVAILKLLCIIFIFNWALQFTESSILITFILYVTLTTSALLFGNVSAYSTTDSVFQF